MIYCHGCLKWVEAEQRFGDVACPTDLDQHLNLFWVCPHCQNFVEDNAGKPAHPIYTPELKNMFAHINKLLDEILNENKKFKGLVYSKIAQALGMDEFNLSWMCCLKEGRRVYRCMLDVQKELKAHPPKKRKAACKRRK